MTRRMSAILGEYSPAGQGCTRHFSVPPLEYKNSTSYKKYRPNFGLNIQESYGKRPIAKKVIQRFIYLKLYLLSSGAHDPLSGDLLELVFEKYGNLLKVSRIHLSLDC